MILDRLLCLLGYHRTVYRERRILHDVEVLHFVCDTCGWADPVMQRTPDEHREATKARLIPR